MFSSGRTTSPRIGRAPGYLRPWVLVPKRIVDLFLGALAIALGALPMLLVAILVRIRLGRPVIFSQLRPGRDGRPFRMYKFRTMLDTCDEHGDPLPDAERLTPFGHWLRSTSLDELPEIWNVIRGEMSLVGPRPLLMRYTPYFREREQLRLKVRPGITGWAQTKGRNTVGWDQRLEYDVWYVENMSLGLDLRIILLTVKGVFRSEGVVTDPESVMKNLDDERKGES